MMRILKKDVSGVGGGLGRRGGGVVKGLTSKKEWLEKRTQL